MPGTSENPFTPSENRDVIFKLRLTKTEHAALERVAKKRGVKIADVLREGAGLVIEKESKESKTSRKKS
jgi:hypothetical protein